MDAQAPSPRTTLVVLLGASQWPDAPEFPGSKAFANAVSGFRRYLLNPLQFGLPKENMLDLFDIDDAPHLIDKKIRQFLELQTTAMKKAGQAARDLPVYFVGHGDFVGRSSEYYLAIRCTSTENLRISAIPMESLASTITDNARYLRRLIILDCCYAAAAFTTFQAEGPAKIGINQTLGAFEHNTKTIGKGTALLCSSGKTVASQIAPDGSCTMFSKALLHVLAHGNRNRPDERFLSLREVADLTEEYIDTVLEKKAPRPELHSPDQVDGDVAKVPFFPNAASARMELTWSTGQKQNAVPKFEAGSELFLSDATRSTLHKLLPDLFSSTPGDSTLASPPLPTWKHKTSRKSLKSSISSEVVSQPPGQPPLQRIPFAQLLRQERESRGWNVPKMAEKVGVTPITISRWEQGIKIPQDGRSIHNLCLLFGKTVEELGLDVSPMATPSVAPSPQVESQSMPFYRILKQERLKRGWKVPELAAKLEVNQTTVAKWEQGSKVPQDPETIRKICTVLGMTTAELGL